MGNCRETILRPRALRLLLVAAAVFLATMSSRADLIVEESEVPRFELPDILQAPHGQTIRTAQDWEAIARPQLLEKFETFVYGRTPRVPILFPNGGAADIGPADAVRMSVEAAESEEVFGGKAVLRQARLRFTRGDLEASFDVLLVLPARPSGPVPTIVALNFWGNHTVDPHPAIRLAPPIPGMEARERGSHAHRWNPEYLIDRGYGVATAFRGEIAPDNCGHFAEGVLSLFLENTGDGRMGAIGAWAWALSRMADYLGSLEAVDTSRLIVAGHSRLGKAALWAAAQDQRFAAVFANNSGCMGAALSRRRFGETVAIITRNFPFWFSPKLSSFAGREDQLPVDQHQLLGLIAPRPIHLGAAREDLWADPNGEFLALREAARVHALHGIEANLPGHMPPPDAIAVGHVLRFHMREGAHDILLADWQAFLSGRE